MNLATDRQNLLRAKNLLLDENLVWDNDFDLIRKQLGYWLTEEALRPGKISLNAITIANKLIKGDSNA